MAQKHGKNVQCQLMPQQSVVIECFLFILLHILTVFSVRIAGVDPDSSNGSASTCFTKNVCICSSHLCKWCFLLFSLY